MSDIDVHEEFDRLDSGISDHPDLAGLWAGGQRRRRRTRAIWTAGALATAAVVAPLALLVGGGGATEPATPGFAAEPTTTSSKVDPAADLTAVVTEFFPDAQADATAPGHFTLASGAILEVVDGSSPEGSMYVRCDGEVDCPERLVGDRFVHVARQEDRGPVVSKTALVYPRSATTSPAVAIIVRATSTAETAAEGEAQLPSDETLSDLAVDERLPLLFTGGGTPEATAAPVDGESDFERMRDALLERFAPSDASYVASDGVHVDGRGLDGVGLYLVTDEGVWVTVYSLRSGERHPCPESGCEQVGDRNVVAVDPAPVEVDGLQQWSRTVQVYPTDPASSALLEVAATVNVTSQEEAEAKLPSVELLTDLALDERLVPPAE